MILEVTMAVGVSVEPPFPGAIYDLADHDMLAFGLFVWMSEKLRQAMSDVYGTAKTDVVILYPHGIRQHFITLEFPNIELKDLGTRVAWSSLDDIYHEAVAVMSELFSSSYLSEYLDYYNRNKKKIAFKASTVLKAETD